MFSVARVQDGRGGGRGENHGDDGGRRESDVGHGRGVLEKRLDEEETTTTTFARSVGMFGIGTVFLLSVLVIKCLCSTAAKNNVCIQREICMLEKDVFVTLTDTKTETDYCYEFPLIGCVRLV